MFFFCSRARATDRRMVDELKPARRDDLFAALAFALTRDGRKRESNAPELMAGIVAERLIERLERSGFVIMQKPPAEGAAAIGRGFETPDLPDKI
jgi:hypothetical protein